MCSSNNTSDVVDSVDQDAHLLSLPNAASDTAAAGVGDDNNQQNFPSSSFRLRPKKQKAPKRGPGVAELEKILREQQEKKHASVEKDEMKTNNFRGIPSSLLPPVLPKTTYLRPSPHSSSNTFSSSSNISLPRDHIPPFNDHTGHRSVDASCNVPVSVTTLPCNVNVNVNRGNNGRSKGVYICKAGVYLPEECLLPVTWASCDFGTRRVEETQRMESDFSFPKLVSKGFDHSNNTVPLHPSMMIGAKRPRPTFYVENWPPAPPPNLPCQSPSFRHHIIPRLDASPSSSSAMPIHGLINPTSSRGPMTSSALELKKQRWIFNDNGNNSGSGSSSPTTLLPSTENCQLDFSKFKQFNFQEMMENSNKGKGLLQKPLSSSSSGSEGSVHKKKSFISILLDAEKENGDHAGEPTLDRFDTEKTAEFIDLNLKL
ncbi:hypothetical protein CCACVL1_15768 [Corchorus capsularis]|uniref:Uncharacterized protein n=1 Tax=Corchorus capsularis TaxID=210143 RepID=A0A1R3I1E7_COCAP|nr:hypothetical protein CCACVL1_15768 [Corchorus capsularis]